MFIISHACDYHKQRSILALLIPTIVPNEFQFQFHTALVCTEAGEGPAEGPSCSDSCDTSGPSERFHSIGLWKSDVNLGTRIMLYVYGFLPLAFFASLTYEFCFQVSYLQATFTRYMLNRQYPGVEEGKWTVCKHGI